MGAGFDTHTIHRKACVGRNIFAHLHHVRRQFRPFGNHCHVHIYRLVSLTAHPFCNLAQNDGGVYILPALVVVRIKVSEIPKSERTKEAIGNSVVNDVCVRVPLQPLFKINKNAGQF